MTVNDTLANALSVMMNAERIGRQHCSVKPFSKMTEAVLTILKKKGYIEGYEVVDDGRGGYLDINLNNMINKCGAVRPRFSVAVGDFEKFEKRFLPARDMGVLVVTTSEGVITHDEAKEKSIGGRLLAYCF